MTGVIFILAVVLMPQTRGKMRKQKKKDMMMTASCRTCEDKRASSA